MLRHHSAFMAGAIAVGAVIGATACNAVWGIDELSFGGGSSTTGPAGSGGAAGSTAGGGAGGSAGGSLPGCGNGVEDGLETAPDCGGGVCPPCGLALACLVGTDCTSGFCLDNRCVECGLTTGWRGPASAGSVDVTGNADGSDMWIVLPPGSAPNVPAALAAEDAARATATVAASRDSLALRTAGFGFSLPSTAILTGILLQLRRATSGTVTNHDLVVQLVSGASALGDNLADTLPVWATSSSFEWKDYGGEGDLWGASLSPGGVNASGFGVQVATHNAYSGGDATAYIDVVRLQIFYCD